MKKVKDLSREELEGIVHAVQRALWFDFSREEFTTDKEWSMDTLDEVSQALRSYGLEPSIDLAHCAEAKPQRSFKTQCPQCGKGPLEVYEGEFCGVGVLLKEDGFRLSEVTDVNTQSEWVECKACGADIAMWELEEDDG